MLGTRFFTPTGTAEGSGGLVLQREEADSVSLDSLKSKLPFCNLCFSQTQVVGLDSKVTMWHIATYCNSNGHFTRSSSIWP